MEQVGAACAALRLGQRCAVITDGNVAPLYSKIICASLEKAGFSTSLIVVPAGEKSKAIRTVERCYHQLAEQRLERKSFVVALGGGVVGDLAGFVAATYLRGIPFVQVPTTLLAQVDSSVGGKVGVNLPAGKNLVGAFHQPRLVLCDLDSLASLPDREYRAGLAEVIKYGIIYDAPFFKQLERSIGALNSRDGRVLAKVIARCCEIKADVVSQDETESGLRAILNFGHTIGHGLEAISKYGKYLHGEAISIGMVAAADLSRRSMSLGEQDRNRIERILAQAGLPTRVQLKATEESRLLRAMQLDKKVSEGVIRFVLARRIGSVECGCNVDLQSIPEVLKSGNTGKETTPFV